MPSPLGHALGGAIVALALADRRAAVPATGASGGSRSLLIWCAVAAMAPDLDFLWGRHNMETHSLGAAAMAGLAAAALVARGARLTAVGDATPLRTSPLRAALAVALAWSTHVLFDWLGSDTTPPIGIMALWPISSEYYFANAFVFDAISRRSHLPGFLTHNITAVLREIAYLVPWLLLAAVTSRRRAVG